MAKAHPKATWAKLKAAYRRGEGSIADLAPKFGIPTATAATRCAKEKWVVERKEVAAKAQTLAVERDVESVAKMLGRHRGLAHRILRLVERKLEEAEAGPTEPPPGAEGAGLDIFGEPVDPASPNRLDVLSGVVARMIPAERLAAGIEPSKPVKPVELNDDAEVVFEIDAPPDEAEG